MGKSKKIKSTYKFIIPLIMGDFIFFWFFFGRNFPFYVEIQNQMEVIYIESMKEAYSMLFTIENGLRRFINDKMTSYYGANWQIKVPKNMSFRTRPLHEAYFYDLENYLRVYPCFNYHDDLIFALRKIYPIRNKIAHCNELTEEEYKMLEDAYELIMDVVYSKVR